MTVKIGGEEPREVKEVTADVMIAADGGASEVRRHFLPQDKRLYRGYCAWRYKQILLFPSCHISNMFSKCCCLYHICLI